MRHRDKQDDFDRFATIEGFESRLLTPKEERELLRELASCKAKLAQALTEVPGYTPPENEDDPRAVSQSIADFYAQVADQGLQHARLGLVHQQYSQLRSRLAMANLRLVAHVARRFRDRGISYGDLIQEGFCGLLEAIDRFDLTHETKLGTYATWWIRQSIQLAVAAGAYPVRLSPRHLRQLAHHQAQIDGDGVSNGMPREASETDRVSAESIDRIHAATRPSVSLDASFEPDSNFSLLQLISNPDGDSTVDVETDETINTLFARLRPREQEVLELRFGLSGKEQLSLSQVGKMMSVSKERVRQIQDRALAKLREAALEIGLMDEELVAH